MSITCVTVVLSKSPEEAIANEFDYSELAERPMTFSEGVTDKNHCRLTVIKVYDDNAQLAHAVFYSVIRGNKTASRIVTSEYKDKSKSDVDILGVEVRKRSTKYPYIVSGYCADLYKGEPFEVANELLHFILNPLRPKDGDTIDLIKLVPHESYLESVLPEYINDFSIRKFSWGFNDYFLVNRFSGPDSVINPRAISTMSNGKGSSIDHLTPSVISKIKSYINVSTSLKTLAKLNDYIVDPNETW